MKLAINQPGDAWEQEADRVSGQVLSMSNPQVHSTCSCGGACDKCQQVQRKTIAESGGSIASGAPPQVQRALNSAGQSLEGGARDFMETRFGRSFDGVRIHTGASAIRANTALGAKAFTAGSHIVFGADQYRPSTREGRSLLAHELTHVVQQSPSSAAVADAPLPIGASPQQIAPQRMHPAALADLEARA
ncbi:MAG TPA: DUF4157 domain-containing protein [Bryobacteraceae bacterium]|nr:DUF4157 domain-containing protein [Bryobacteraceae bacterium]